MAGPNPLLTKAFDAGAAITEKRLLKMGSNDDELIHAVDGAAAIMAVAAQTVASGVRVDAHVIGVVTVKLGGTVARGDYLTSGAAGVAVKSDPASGVNSNVAGIAMASGVNDDEIEMLIAPSRIQG